MAAEGAADGEHLLLEDSSGLAMRQIENDPVEARLLGHVGAGFCNRALRRCRHVEELQIFHSDIAVMLDDTEIRPDIVALAADFMQGAAR